MDPRESNPLQSYINNRLDTEQFEAFRTDVDSTGDDRLWQLMGECTATSPCEVMPDETRRRILSNLHRYILRRRIALGARIACGVAALCAIVSVTVLLVPEHPAMQPVSFSVKAGSKGEITLSDGTVCRLNSISTLVSDMTSPDSRSITITGEAFFDVAPDPERPLTVKAGEVSVTVTGTSFNVNAYTPGIVETSLVSGSVVISSPALPKNYDLTPGEQAIVDLYSKTVSIHTFDPDLSTAWTLDRLVFYSEPLEEVIARIERWYGVDIDLQRPDIAKDILSGSYHRESIENVMQSLSSQYEFNYRIDRDKIVIY